MIKPRNVLPSGGGERNLSRRERQIMDVIYSRGQATAAEVIKDLPDPPSYSAIRALLGILERKGHLKHKVDGPRYVYSPKRPRVKAAKAALGRVLQTFFDGSTERAVAALLDREDRDISDSELDRLATLIEKAKKEGR